MDVGHARRCMAYAARVMDPPTSDKPQTKVATVSHALALAGSLHSAKKPAIKPKSLGGAHADA